MDKKDEVKLEVTPEEQKAEEEAQKEVNETELRGKLAEEFGIDPETDVELLDKIVAREKANREKLSGAIKQKIGWRTKAQQLPKEPGGQKNDKDKPDIDKLIDQKVAERLEARDLDSLSFPNDEIKEEVKTLAKLKGISIKEAAKLPYIVNRIADVEKEKRIINATPKRSAKGGGQISYDPTKPLDPNDFALDTPEGQKAWAEAKAARRKHTG